MKELRRTFTPLRSLCVFVPAAVLGTILGKRYGLNDLSGIVGAVLVMVACAFLVLAYQAVTAGANEVVTLNVDGKLYTLPNHRI